MPSWKDYERFLQHDGWEYISKNSGTDKFYIKIFSGGRIVLGDDNRRWDGHAAADQIPAFWSFRGLASISTNKASCDRTDMSMLNILPIAQRSGL